MGHEFTVGNGAIARFTAGAPITIVAYVPWYKRIWRRFFPVHTSALMVTDVDHATGTITFTQMPVCTCRSKTDRHKRKCDLVAAWLTDFGVDNPMVPDWPIPDVVDLSDTRFAK